MTLGQGCRRRTPWWCWLIALGTAALTLPGAAFVVRAQDKSPQAEAPLNDERVPLSAQKADGSPQPAPPVPVDEELRAYQVANRDSTITTVVYETAEFAHLLTGAQDEQQSKFEQLVRSRRPAREAQINWFDGKPIVKTTVAGHTAVRKCLSMFVGTKATAETFDEFLDSVAGSNKSVLVCELQMISAEEAALSQLEDAVQEHSTQPDGPGRWVIPADKWDEALLSVDTGNIRRISSPQVATHNGVNVQVESVTQHTVGLKQEDDGSLIPCMNWAGWKTHLLPFTRDDGSYWVGIWFEQGTVTDTRTPTTKEAPQLGTTEPVNVHSYGVLNFAATLKEDQVVVFPGPVSGEGAAPEQWPLLTARIRHLSDKPAPNAIPSPPHISGTGVKSGNHRQADIEPASATQPAISTKRFSRQMQLGPIRLSVRKRDDGTDSRELIVTAETANGNGVLAGTAESLGLRDQSGKLSVHLTEARLQVPAPDGAHRIEAHKLTLTLDDVPADQAASVIRMRGESVDVQVGSAGKDSRLKADKVDLLLNVTTLAIDELHGSGLASLQTTPELVEETLRLQGRTTHNDKATDSPEAARTRAALEKRQTVNLEQRSLGDFVEWIRDTARVDVVVDQRALEEEGYTLQIPVELVIEHQRIRFSSILRLVLEPRGLATTIDPESGVLVITSKQALRGRLIAAAYPVADLVVPVPPAIIVTNAIDGEQAPSVSPQPDARALDTSADALIDLIQSTVDADSWSVVGGSGRIEFNRRTLSLVIRQTQQVHAEISDLLGQLRRLQDLQVTLEVESLAVPPSFLTEWNVDLQFQPLGESKTQRFMKLSKEQAAQLRNGSTVGTFPKATVFNGRHSEWGFGEFDGRQPQLNVQAVASSDRRSVRLGVSVDDFQTEFAGWDSLAAIPAIPDGDAVLLELPDLTEALAAGQPQVGVPILGRPKAFRAVAAPRRFVLIQPRVVIVEEEEELLGLEP